MPLTRLANVRASCVPALGSVRLTAPSKQRAERTLVFTPNPRLAEGPFSGSIELVGVREGGESLPAFPIPVEGKVMPEVYAIPERLDFGFGTVGKAMTASVVVQSAGGRNFEITGVKTAGLAGSAAVASRAAAGGKRASHTLDVSFSPGKQGHNTAEVRVSIRDADGKEKELVVALGSYVSGTTARVAEGQGTK
ncbi:MAG: hypothetical protein ACYC35_28555 [Pirellulales bacterium]